MKPGRTSVSALGSAVLRAAHVAEDPPPWVLEDTVSASLLTSDERARVEASMAEWPRDVRAGFRLAHAVRARVAEDVAVGGVEVDRRDYVILGAGLDSFAWRHPRASELTIWELDHPDTQRWKRRALERSGWATPSNVRFVEIDLAADRLDGLALPGRATWNWLGVTMYLEKTATAQTLRSIASRAAGTVLVVNFLLDRDERSGPDNRLQGAARRVLNVADEPIRATYTKSEVEDVLGESGFTTTSVLMGEDLARRYLPDRSDLRMPSSTVIAVATT